MGISYIVITLFIVLALEALIITAAFLIFTRSPIIGYWTLQRADHVAQIYALQAAVQAEGDSLNPNTTFEPGHETSLSFRQESDPEQFAFCLTGSHLRFWSTAIGGCWQAPCRSTFLYLAMSMIACPKKESSFKEPCEGTRMELSKSHRTGCWHPWLVQSGAKMANR
jgi:hypothetical protein